MRLAAPFLFFFPSAVKRTVLKVYSLVLEFPSLDVLISLFLYQPLAVLCCQFVYLV